MLKPATKRLLSLVLALFFLLGAAVVYFEFVRGEYEALQKQKSEALSRERLVQSQREAVAQVRALIEAYQGEASLQEQVSLALPTSPEAARALADLNGLAQNNRLIPQSFSAGTVAVEGYRAAPGGETSYAETSSPASLVRPLGSINFQIRLTGTYNDFKAFLKYLETNLRIFDVRTLTIQPSGKPQDPLYAYDITVATYYQLP